MDFMYSEQGREFLMEEARRQDSEDRANVESCINRMFEQKHGGRRLHIAYLDICEPGDVLMIESSMGIALINVHMNSADATIDVISAFLLKAYRSADVMVCGWNGEFYSSYFEIPGMYRDSVVENLAGLFCYTQEIIEVWRDNDG